MKTRIIAMTSVDWKGFCDLSEELTGINVVRNMKSLQASPAYIEALAEFESPIGNRPAMLREAGPLLRHFMVSIMSKLDSREFQVLYRITKLNFIEQGSAIIATGTLHEWRTAIVDCLPYGPTNEFLTACYNEFVRVGLGDLWKDYSQVFTPKGMILRK